MTLVNIYTDITIKEEGKVVIKDTYPLVIDADILRGKTRPLADESILTAVRKRNLVPNSMTIELNNVLSADEAFNKIYNATIVHEIVNE